MSDSRARPWTDLPGPGTPDRPAPSFPAATRLPHRPGHHFTPVTQETDHVRAHSRRRPRPRFSPRLRRARPGTRTTVICDSTSIGRIRKPGENARVICLRKEAPSRNGDLAMAGHKVDPFTRIGSFGESDQFPYAAIAGTLGLPAHSPHTVNLANDKAAMRAWLREKIFCELPPSGQLFVRQFA